MAILKSLVCSFLLSVSVIYALQPRQSNNLILEDSSTEYPSLSTIPEQSTPDLKKIRGCGLHEIFSSCEAHCEVTCDNKSPPCPRFCISGCVCEEGYARDVSGRCIPMDQCPVQQEAQTLQGPRRCRVNEHFDVCKGHCQKNCHNYNTQIPCADICISGCVCNAGYVRGPGGICIPKRQCPISLQSQPTDTPPKCEENEYFEVCNAHCQKDCSNYDSPVYCPAICIPGCVCQEGYVKGSEGKCILVEQCPSLSERQPLRTPPRCEENEYFDVCKAHCQKNCDNYEDTMDCPATCVPGCVCQEGYVRGPEGTCIPEEQCSAPSESQQLKTPPRCPAHEFFHVCNAHCQKDCSNFDRPTPCPAICVPGCICKKGYVRGPDGQCIPSQQCPLNESQVQSAELKCEENEYFDVCKAHCQKDCRNTNSQRYCPDICVPGCMCKMGYVRGAEGSCIPVEQCQEQSQSQSSQDFTICPRNEHFDVCLGHCQKDCNNLNNPLICPNVCIPGCVCNEGYVRGPRGKCIPERQCQVPTQSQSSCPLNERFDRCKAHCQKNCFNYNEISMCSDECIPGCVCEDGFVRGPQGKCIPLRQCSKLNEEQSYIPPFDRICPPREHWEFCTGHCQRNCSNYDKPLVCPQICVEGCLCDRGYTRGPKGDCIPDSECEALRTEQPLESSFDVCSENAEFSLCLANPMCQKTCSNYDKSIYCPKICIPGCVCKMGYVKSSEGECVPVETCSRQNEALQKVCPVNMQYSECEADPWCQMSCKNPSEVDSSCPRQCVSGCVCKEGFVRGPHGYCVALESCPLFSEPESESIQYSVESCPENEEYSMSEAACQKNCMNYDKPQHYCPVTVVPGCVCKKGFVRSAYGQCIPVEKCSEELTKAGEPYECPRNKHYSRCGGSVLCQETCSTYQKPDSCAVMCIEGCVCDEGFVLSPEGDCIPPSQCPEQKYIKYIQNRFPMPLICKKDEQFSMCATCQDDCSNYEDTNKKCGPLCLPGCACKKGTVRGPDGDCIEPQQCSVEKKPEDCTMYEYYDTCGTSCPDDCTNYNQQNKQCNHRCVAGCFCQPGFVKGPNGDCIFPFNCPKQQDSPLDIQKPQQTSEDSLNYGCPNEKSCNTVCKRRGKSYGVCIGPMHSNCQCF